MKTAFALILGCALALCPLRVHAAWNFLEVNQPAAQAAQQQDLDQLLSIAESQHEIARLLIKEGQFERVLPEMRKILDLNLPEEYEQLVAKSASFIAYLLNENRRYSLGHELLDEASAKMRLSENAASLLKIKAYIYKSEGKLSKAIETLERAVELERQRRP